MCADANAGARFAAKQKWLDKNAKYRSEGLKYFNREAGYKKSLQDNVIGFTRATSDAYSKAVYARGSAMKQTESLMKNYFRKQKVNQGGRSFVNNVPEEGFLTAIDIPLRLSCKHYRFFINSGST